MVAMYWSIGKRIREDILHEKRAEYGEEIVQTVSAQLTLEYGRGFGRRNLFYMVQFAEAFPDAEIVQTLSGQLSWSHFLAIIPLDHSLKRDFYAEMCRLERWSVRTLRQKIDRLLFERTAVSKKPDELIRRDLDALREDDRLTPDLVFRDPYFLDFLGLAGSYSEKDVEQAILRELEAFILELGTDFAFLARQKRITVDDEDYYLDLLFYHRKLRRLVAVDLKIGKFQAADKGQMETLLAVAGGERSAARRGAAPGSGPVRRQDRRARASAAVGAERYPGGTIPDRASAAEGLGKEAARRHPPGPRTACPATAGAASSTRSAGVKESCGLRQSQ